jgi:hypothetical protein
MKKVLVLGAFLVVLSVAVGYVLLGVGPVTDDDVFNDSFSATEPGFDPEPSVELLPDITVGAPGKYTIAELQNWERPAGPLKVGIQVGHWQNASMPEELKNLERNTGASWGGMTEAEVVLVISELIQQQLQAAGIEAELLPATVPPGYVADAFVAIHADGNTSTKANGFKFSAPARDYAGTSQALVDIMYDTYAVATGLRVDSSITRRMTSYYAFNWPRYEYAIHPFTPAVIVEAGFLTSPVDRVIIVDQPERAATGVANAVIEFLQTESIKRAPLPTAFTSLPQLPIKGEVVCAPRRVARQSVSENDCFPSIVDSAGVTYLLANYSSTTLPIGSVFTADGQYIPIQNLGTYFWFPYQVDGLIVDPALPMIDRWFMR